MASIKFWELVPVVLLDLLLSLPNTVASSLGECGPDKYRDPLGYCKRCDDLCDPRRGQGDECRANCAGFLERQATTVPTTEALTTAGSDVTAYDDNSQMIILIMVAVSVAGMLCASAVAVVIRRLINKQKRKRQGEEDPKPNSELTDVESMLLTNDVPD